MTCKHLFIEDIVAENAVCVECRHIVALDGPELIAARKTRRYIDHVNPMWETLVKVAKREAVPPLRQVRAWDTDFSNDFKPRSNPFHKIMATLRRLLS